ncbi:FAD-dependent oxidoreductase [Saccharopolyspora sp. ID03-671]|uniref:GcvT family protein n=1 Tax=Saccharopolyspora sp. ID03-671 TaxID=3073066 RepID=UPI0032533822
MVTSAHILLVGAGIVGCSTALHLARQGITDVLVVDQGPLPATGGSSSHAPGLVFQTNASETMSRLAADTVALYSSLEVDGQPCFHPVGGIEVATTPERWDDLRRKLGLATAWGIDAELLDPGQVRERIPAIDAGYVLGGLHVASDGIAKPVRAAEAMMREARGLGVRFEGGVEVTGFDVRDNRITGVRTGSGDVAAEIVVCCAGIWGPKIGRMAGVTIPVQPLAHQYAVTTPVLPDSETEVAQPILRHQDHSMYFRQARDRYGIGSYRHRVIPVSTDELSPTAAPGTEAPPEGGGWKGMASVHPFTPADFAGPWQEARRLLPVLREAEIGEGMNGLFLFTADGMPVLGRSEVDNFWIAEAVWITHAGGVGKAMAQWLAGRTPEIDLRQADLRRFDDFARSPSYLAQRSAQSFREVYDIIHPQQPPERPRPLRTSPFHDRQRDLGAVFLEANGWERPHWYGCNEPLLEGRDIAEPGPWAGRFWSPIVGAEHLALRERVAMVDMTPLARAEVTGPGAEALLDRLTTGRIDRPPGYVTYALMLTPEGGVRSDVTVARLGRDHFQVGCNGPRDIAWLRDNAETGTQVRDITGGTCCIGLWGPRARDVLAPLADVDVSHEAFGLFRARRLHVGEVPVVALRLSYVGELGWELYTSADFGRRLWDLLAASEHGAFPAGRGAFNGLRIEKGYRAWGTDMWTEHTPAEAGLAFAVKPDKGPFVGREAFLRQGEPARRLRCLRIDDGTVLTGSEPVLADGTPIGFTTSAAYGHTLDASLAYAWLPTDADTDLTIRYFDEPHPATVIDDPAFDPRMTRMRC